MGCCAGAMFSAQWHMVVQLKPLARRVIERISRDVPVKSALFAPPCDLLFFLKRFDDKIFADFIRALCKRSIKFIYFLSKYLKFNF